MKLFQKRIEALGSIRYFNDRYRALKQVPEFSSLLHGVSRLVRCEPRWYHSIRRLESYADQLGLTVLSVEQNIVDTVDARYWVRDQRLRCIALGMVICGRADGSSATILLNPTGGQIQISAYNVQLGGDFAYDEAGELALNFIALPYIETTERIRARALQLQETSRNAGSDSGMPYHEAYRIATNERKDEVVQSLIKSLSSYRRSCIAPDSSTNVKDGGCRVIDIHSAAPSQTQVHVQG